MSYKTEKYKLQGIKRTKSNVTNIDDYRVEHQFNYQQGNFMTPVMTGHLDDVRTRVIVKSEAATKVVNQCAGQSLRSCFAGEGVQNETAMDLNIYLNGNIINLRLTQFNKAYEKLFNTLEKLIMSDIPLNYATAYNWTGEGEKGEMRIGDLPVLPIGSPHNADCYSPEHLLVVAAEACLANYVLLISQMSGLNIKAYNSTTEGELVKEGNTGYRFKRIVIRPVVTVESGKEGTVERIITKAHDLCMVARALNCPVDVEPGIELKYNNPSDHQ